MAAKDERDADTKAPAPAKQTTPDRIPVRALETGFYGGGRRRKGEQFTISGALATEGKNAGKPLELGKWMERRDTQEAQEMDAADAARAADAAKFAK